MSARTRSEDEETIHYSMSEGEEGDLAAPTPSTPAPEGTPTEGSWPQKKKMRRKKKGTGAGAGGGHPPPCPPPAAGGSSGTTSSRLETSWFVKQFTYNTFSVTDIFISTAEM